MAKSISTVEERVVTMEENEWMDKVWNIIITKSTTKGRVELEIRDQIRGKGCEISKDTENFIGDVDVFHCFKHLIVSTEIGELTSIDGGSLGMHVTMEEEEVQTVESMGNHRRGSDKLGCFKIGGREYATVKSTNSEDEKSSVGDKSSGMVNSFAFMDVGVKIKD